MNPDPYENMLTISWNIDLQKYVVKHFGGEVDAFDSIEDACAEIIQAEHCEIRGEASRGVPSVGTSFAEFVAMQEQNDPNFKLLLDEARAKYKI